MDKAKSCVGGSSLLEKGVPRRDKRRGQPAYSGRPFFVPSSQRVLGCPALVGQLAGGLGFPEREKNEERKKRMKLRHNILYLFSCLHNFAVYLFVYRQTVIASP